MSDPTYIPQYCPHGRVLSWEVRNARAGDPFPFVEQCDECNPGSVPLDDTAG